MSAIVDIEASLVSWAAEALLNSADGYYGGFHNFLIYDQGAKGFVFLPQDTDATFDWLALFDLPGARNHPIFWWEGRAVPAPTPGPHWMTVMSDADWRKKYAEAMAELLDDWDVRAVRRVDRHVVAADRAGRRGGSAHLGGPPATSRPRVGGRAQVVEDRPEVPAQLRRLRARRHRRRPRRRRLQAGATTAATTIAAIHLGAPERCNGVDDNCNGIADEGCQ